MAQTDYFNILNTITLRSINIKDIFSRYDIFNDSNNYIEYNVKDGEDLLSISDKFYGTKRYWWIIALFNEIHDPFYDIPLPQNELRDYVEKYLDEEADSGDTFDSLWDDFTDENETKRTIKIIEPTLIPEIMKQFKEEVDKIQNS